MGDEVSDAVAGKDSANGRGHPRGSKPWPTNRPTDHDVDAGIPEKGDVKRERLP